MRLRTNRIAHPVTALGPGRRIAVWVQGCSIGCVGCASVDTWDPSSGESLDTRDLAALLADLITCNGLTGLTITGGEPTEQAEAVADLVVRVRSRLLDQADHEPIDVLLFTGRTAAAASRSAGRLWNAVDAAVCGPYRQDLPSNHPWVASSNQELVIRTELGYARHSTVPTRSRTLQANLDSGELTLVGLPGPGDLQRIEAALRQRGVEIGGRSWELSS